MTTPDLLQPHAARTGAAAGLAGNREKPVSEAKLRQTAEEFEAVFLAQVLQTMKVGIGGPGPMSEGDNEAWTGMLQEEYGKLISRSGGIGVADVLMREMLKMQEMG